MKYAEIYYPELLPNISTCKSPQEMMGATIKSYLAQKQNIDPKDIFVVSVMPCTAKKFEAQRPELSSDAGVADVDAVITTRQLNRMMQIFGIEFASLPEEEFDRPFGAPTGSGDIFAASGGVMESALRTAYPPAHRRGPREGRLRGRARHGRGEGSRGDHRRDRPSGSPWPTAWATRGRSPSA